MPGVGVWGGGWERGGGKRGGERERGSGRGRERRSDTDLYPPNPTQGRRLNRISETEAIGSEEAGQTGGAPAALPKRLHRRAPWNMQRARNAAVMLARLADTHVLCSDNSSLELEFASQNDDAYGATQRAGRGRGTPAREKVPGWSDEEAGGVIEGVDGRTDRFDL